LVWRLRNLRKKGRSNISKKTIDRREGKENKGKPRKDEQRNGKNANTDSIPGKEGKSDNWKMTVRTIGEKGRWIMV